MYPAMASSIKVFSAHAEVVPACVCACVVWVSILRARGGSSNRFDSVTIEALYSPRTRR